MTNTIVPESDDISRLCFRKFAPDGQIESTAFMLRDGEEGLSVNWLKLLNCSNRDEEIQAIRNIYRNAFTRPELNSNDKIAVLNVGNMRNHVSSNSPDSRDLQVIHRSSSTSSHCEVYNMRPDQEMIAELIFQTIIEEYPAQ